MKKSTLLVLSSMLVFGLAACGGNNNTASSNDAGNTSDTTTSETVGTSETTSEAAASSENVTTSEVATSEVVSSQGPAVGPVDNDTLKEAADKYVMRAAMNASKVKEGSFKSTTVDPYNPVEAPTINDGTYEFGDDYFHTRTLNWSIYEHSYYVTESDGVNKYSGAEGDPLSKSPSDEDHLGGIDFTYSYRGNFLGGDIYGAEAMLSSTWSLAKSENAKELAGELTETGFKASFKYDNITEWSEEYFTFEFEASFSENALVAFKVVTDNSAMLDETNEFGAPTGNKALTWQYTQTYEIAQTLGERTATFPYDLSDFDFTSWDIYCGETKIEDKSTVDVEMDEYGGVSLKVMNQLPESATAKIDSFKIEYDEGGICNFASYGSYNQQINLNFNRAGSCKFKVSTKNVSVEFTLNVKAPSLSAIEASQWTYLEWDWEPGNGSWMDSYMMGTEGVVGEEFLFEVKATPSTADNSATITVTAEEGTWTLGTKEVDVWGSPKSLHSLKVTKAQTVKLKVTSTVDPTISSEYEIVFSVAAAE